MWYDWDYDDTGSNVQNLLVEPSADKGEKTGRKSSIFFTNMIMNSHKC